MANDNFIVDTAELENIIESLNQLDSYEALDLGANPHEIREAFEIAIGIRQPSPKARLAHSILHSRDAPYDREPHEDAKEKSFKSTSWTLSLTNAFVKETKGIDRKLQGRILECLLDLINEPMTVRGDTCKPLSGKLAGLWRLRIGDARLIYKPDTCMHIVYCLSFSSRGEAY